MKLSRTWLPQEEKHPAKDDITKCAEPLTVDRLTARLVIGSVVFVGVTSVVLGILWDSPKKAVPLKVDAAQLSPQLTQRDGVDVKSKSVMVDPPVIGTSGYPSSLPTPELATSAPPASPDQPPLVKMPVARRFGAEAEERGWRLPRRLSAVAQKPGHVRDSKRKWPKAFIDYLEAHQDFLRKSLRTGK